MMAALKFIGLVLAGLAIAWGLILFLQLIVSAI